MRSSMTVVASALAVVVASGTAVLALPAPPAGPALPAAPLAAPDAPARVLPLPKASATPAAIDILPLDQVRPGMVGVGRTVFEGTKIEEFKVTVIGVLENVGPKQSMILARLDRGPLEKTGIIAGMSGSPVYIDGKLVGAVAYGFPFSKETIGGITPISEMIDATRTGGPRAASARFPTPFSAAGPKAPLDRESFVAALRRPIPSIPLAAGMPSVLVGQSLTPISVPLTFAGFDPATF